MFIYGRFWSRSFFRKSQKICLHRFFCGKFHFEWNFVCLTYFFKVKTDFFLILFLANGNPHVGCGKSGTYGKYCPPERELIKINDELKTYILDQHNQFRSRVASGQENGYEEAG